MYNTYNIVIKILLLIKLFNQEIVNLFMFYKFVCLSFMYIYNIFYIWKKFKQYA